MTWTLSSLQLRHWVLLVFLSSALFIHFRGKDRFELKRALDFTILLAPINALMVLFSRVPANAYIDPRAFADLAPLRVHWLFMEGRGRGTDMRYAYSPLRGLVDVQGNE